MDVLSILRLYGLPVHKEVKIYQHIDHAQVSIQEIIDSGDFEEYQTVHSGDVLGQGFVVSFVREKAGLCRFLGVWEVKGVGKRKEPNRERDLSVYQLDRLPMFDDLVDRMMIRWPVGRTAHRWLSRPNEIMPQIAIEQIRQKGFSGDFPGYEDVILKHADLRKLASSENLSSNWIAALRFTRGVYLITDTESGDLYVGSATGADGIWGRWLGYATTVHGGNKILIDKTLGTLSYADRLQFSILETLSNLASADDGLRAEARWKRKLGKKATILNAN